MSELKPQERNFWDRFVERNGLKRTGSLRVSASMPGNKVIADELVALYLAGKKTAGSGLLEDYELAGEPVPKPGDYWIILDSRERPRCIAQTVRIETHPFDEVTEEIARAEGEGDLSIGYWREAHRKFFTPFLSKLGIGDLNKALVVTEFFEIVYPVASENELR